MGDESRLMLRTFNQSEGRWWGNRFSNPSSPPPSPTHTHFLNFCCFILISKIHLMDFNIWVSFCKTGKMAVSSHIFSKSRAFVWVVMLIYFTHIDWLDECVLFVRLHSFHCIALTNFIPPGDKNQGLIACCAAGAKKIQNLFIQMLSRVTTFVPDFITILPKSWNKCFTTILLSGQLNSKFLYAIFLFSCHTFCEHNEKVL